MQKTYVLDTNVLLHSPQALLAFGDNKIVIPEVVLEELDDFKKRNNELGANARAVARKIEALCGKGKLSEGVPLENGGILKIETNYYDVEMPSAWDVLSPDNRIIQVCKGLSASGEKVFLVTKDIFERIKADVLDVVAQDFLYDRAPNIEEQYKGRIDLYTTPENLAAFFNEAKSIDPQDTKYYEKGKIEGVKPDLVTNQFVILHSNINYKQTALGRFDGQKIVLLNFLKETPFGVVPRNVGQRFMQEALYADASQVPLVIVKGPAGTAKTFYSLAVGLHKMLEEYPRRFRKILVCRPNVKLDEEIGFLPGTEEDKIAPLMRPIRDNLQILLDSDEERRYANEGELEDKVGELFDRKIIKTEAIAFLRGRSIMKQWVIIDEAQNLTPKQVKSIITRAGKGTKIILVGDPEQIDHPFLDSRTNGLCYASERMKGSPLCYQLTMLDDECERSALAAEGAKRM